MGTDTAGVEPRLLGIGAAMAAERLLASQAVAADDVDLVEFNEAFASQTLACLDRLGIGPERANADGGALALGHAYGASGAVLVTRLLAQARQAPDRTRLALAMISIAGGMGTAALFRAGVAETAGGADGAVAGAEGFQSSGGSSSSGGASSSSGGPQSSSA